MFYGKDIEGSMLQVQLQTLAAYFKDVRCQVTLQDIVAHFKVLSTSKCQIYSEAVTIMNLILVNPPINVISERSFSWPQEAYCHVLICAAVAAVVTAALARMS